MIFQDCWQQVLQGRKTVTRLPVQATHLPHFGPDGAISRVSLHPSRQAKWIVGNCYAVQPEPNARGVGRIRLTAIWPERLQSITEAGVRAEGFSSLAAFHMAWNRYYSHLGVRWHDNPVVWVLQFEVAEVCAVEMLDAA